MHPTMKDAEGAARYRWLRGRVDGWVGPLPATEATGEVGMSVEKEILTVGFDKNGEADFGVSMSVCELTFSQMKELRAMLPVAIGVLENAWRDEQMRKPENEMNGWLKVGMVKPRCPRDPDALGEPVLIWPRNPQGEEHSGVDGHAYYGRRATGRPAFYKHGAEIRGVTHWMPMPKGPNAELRGASQLAGAASRSNAGLGEEG